MGEPAGGIRSGRPQSRHPRYRAPPQHGAARPLQPARAGFFVWSIGAIFKTVSHS